MPIQKITRALTHHPYALLCGVGALFTLGFAPFFIWPLALVCLGVLFYSVMAAPTGRSALGRGFFFGVGHFVSGLYWLPYAFKNDFGAWEPALMAGVPAVLALAIYLACYPAIACALWWKLRQKLPKHAFDGPLLFAVLWVGAEMVRGWAFTGLPWNLTGYIFADEVWLMQVAAPLKVWGLSLLACYVGASLVSTHYQKTLGVGALGIAALWGAFVVAQADKAPTTRGLTVRMVQAAIPQPFKWLPEYRYRHLERHLELSVEGGKRADVVVWPETAVTMLLEEDEFLQRTVSSILRRGETLVTGAPRRVMDETGATLYRNSILSLNAYGEVTDVYDKKHLVPFGEYIPLRQWMPPFVQKMVYGREDYTAGNGPQSLDLGRGITALPLICFEAIYPRYVARHANEEDVLITLTNDGWFDGSIAPYQHLAMARLRAVEARKPLIRVANTGISAVIDPYGRVLEKISHGVSGVKDVHIPLK